MESKKNQSKILIVDDTINNIQVLGPILKNAGYAIYVAQDGEHALKVLDKVMPNLILLDIMMPVMNGFETCKRIKENQSTKDIPIIFLTAKTELDDIVKGFQLGAIDYITKPFNSVELLIRVKTHIDLKQSKDTIERISHERKELLHVLCHDLINPFHSIIALLDYIKSYEDYTSFRNQIYSSAQNGLDIIELVRNLRSVEEKKLTLDKVNLFDAVQSSLMYLNAKFLEKNISVTINILDDVYIWAEPISLMNSVINNLLTNAIKFSYPNSSINISSDRKTDKHVILTIQDYGIGIPEIILNKLFDVSQPTSRKGTNGERGTGFGMPLVQKFMHAYNGEIEVFSRDETSHTDSHGTTIILSFNIADFD